MDQRLGQEGESLQGGAASRLRVGFDAMNLSLEKGTGVATYTRNLALAAQALGHTTGFLYATPGDVPKSPLEREVALFDAPRAGRTSKALQGARAVLDALPDLIGITARAIPITGTVLTQGLSEKWIECDHIFAARRVFDRARVAFALSNRFLEIKLPIKLDLFHWTYPIPARVVGCANIYTVHDIIPVRLPYTTLDWKSYYIRLIRKLVATADHIVTVSENSKRDMINYFDVEEHRISNTYQSVSVPSPVLAMKEEELQSELAGVFGLQLRNYLLYYGSIEPKKNLGRVIEAYLSADVKLPLVVVAAQSWESEKELRLLKQERIKRQQRIHVYDYMPWRMLAALVRGARAVLFPSLYEGFGLPVLEAMALDSPVVTSNQSSIPEVAGDAAVMVDPYDVRAIARAIAAVATDDALCAELRHKGLARAALFLPEAYQERIAELYNKLLAGKRSLPMPHEQ